MEIIFPSHANKTHFYKKGCAPSLILKVRVFGTRKWPIRIDFLRTLLIHPWGARVSQWWEHLPPSNMVWVQLFKVFFGRQSNERNFNIFSNIGKTPLALLGEVANASPRQTPPTCLGFPTPIPPRVCLVPPCQSRTFGWAWIGFPFSLRDFKVMLLATIHNDDF